jgi:hypothetical protein
VNKIDEAPDVAIPSSAQIRPGAEYKIINPNDKTREEIEKYSIPPNT